ncbi:transcription cofactor vestigial-like protein 1 [Delphinus delphis]|uniref:Transcription cofactor vestigial-like protein 1 n=1 Tax=Tursiops truncatus TaxID=9739 RepID=A0A2U3V669_TURTR|nr:transcription cofactor vestigial-like protein 1 [Tursiops truncatus]XP_059858722.1 transcription cofactor vestigial-like protein 1 [Delphinus delphis]
MEEVRKTAVQMQSPIKTEWNSRCVLFTYFQGDISSVVDEHFSRALGNVKSPQGLSPSSQSGDVILRNDSGMPPNQWRFSSQWTKPQPEVSFANGAASCSLSGSGPMAVDQYPVSLTGSPSIQPGEPRHFSSLASSSFPELGYPHAFSTGHSVPETQPDGKYEPLLSLLQPERCLTHPQESASWEDGNSAQTAGSMGLLFNLPSGSAHSKEMPPDAWRIASDWLWLRVSWREMGCEDDLLPLQLRGF